MVLYARTLCKIKGHLGLYNSMIRIDYAPCRLTSPHTHPRATEILKELYKLGLSLLITPITLSPRCCKRVMFSCSLCVGLVHFQRNVGNGYAVAIAGLSSQNPGAITMANAFFGTNNSKWIKVWWISLNQSSRVTKILMSYA
ncbi:putative germin, rmlC-like cupin domain superfamily, rmlC-like jelly roll [Helianthus annuus]|nr:putative germin, rmlC-like cupin domain superfamily, rmlC-like jelly roll [Helianthus annuus]KAJ0827813.1 putative germin, rmlC-like cupin domain superfamily, rmlC-like jelly roll [Helianthus annuus]